MRRQDNIARAGTLLRQSNPVFRTKTSSLCPNAVYYPKTSLAAYKLRSVA